MPKDNGAWWALGAAAALAGVAAASRRRRGGQNTQKIRFMVKPRVILRCPRHGSVYSEVDVPWDGDPATLPTREQVLDAWRQKQNRAYDEELEDVAWEVTFNDISSEPGEWTDFSVDSADTWHVEPEIDVRRGLGGRKRITAAGHPITMQQISRYSSKTHDGDGNPR